MENTSINAIMQQAKAAFDLYKRYSDKLRAEFLENIAAQIEAKREDLVEIAHLESNLPLPRLNGELTRTTGQLKMFANLLKEGSWVNAVIDTADASRTPPNPDTRKINIPIGPIVVFGASNFPFAFSTAGGDTASALASGCSVIIKGHSAHAKTSEMMFEAIKQAINDCLMPEFVVQHVLGSGATVGKDLVQHPNSKAVGFTGSFHGGTALIDYARNREIPIPVYAEMSSINPVVFLPDTLHKNTNNLATTFAGSITLGMGQFCTNPGLLIATQSADLDNFIQLLGDEIKKIMPQKMLHTGIAKAYAAEIEKISEQNGVELIAQAETAAMANEALPLLAKVNAKTFMANKILYEEAFGPYSLIVCCDDKSELITVLKSLNGQLTTTIMATDTDIAENFDLIEIQTEIAGRIILNAAPTGVEVCASMVHGGPYPSTSDQKFTSVGTSAIMRWVRPVCYQGFNDNMLPDGLKKENPLKIWRILDNEYSKSNG